MAVSRGAAPPPRTLAERLEFPFPTPEVHAGIPLGNGVFGALVGSNQNRVSLVINRADYWDHRGGLEFGPDATYDNLKTWLESGNETRLREVFEGSRQVEPGVPPRPTRLPMGRMELVLPSGWAVQSGGLHLSNGEAELELSGWGRRSGRGAEIAKLRAVLLRDRPVLCVRVTGLDGAEIRVESRPPDSPEVLKHFREFGFPPAERFDLGEFGGWVQECPEEPAMCAGWLTHSAPGGLILYVTAVFAESPVAARRDALSMLEQARSEGFTPVSARTYSWWGRWWTQGAEVRLDDPHAERLYYLGMYKLAGLSVPGSPAATLQGPWVEDHRLPPWSGDYHFNINVQECYWPAFSGNHLECLEPLSRMLREWEPTLRANARAFVGAVDGRMLPHSTDDRGRAMSGFWTGFVDHGSTAWTGHLLWQYARYSGDREFLRHTAYPFLKGAMRVYEAMLEDLGREFSLPVSVSPEYGGAALEAWGRNASFQLALIHWLCRALIEISGLLNLDTADRQRWEEIDRRLPLGAIDPDQGLLLWEGQPLAESHRHHSHLAGIYPFDIFDSLGEHRQLIRQSLRRHTEVGMGKWTGWCVPWAAILHARLGNGEQVSLMLDLYRRVFVGPGHFSTHDARFAGVSVMDRRPDIMQLEASLGAAAAVLEMLLHTANGVLKVFPAVPPHWRDVSFDRIRADGAFLVSAVRSEGETRSVKIHSEVGATLKIANPWGDGPFQIRQAGEPVRHVRGRHLELSTASGASLELSRA